MLQLYFSLKQFVSCSKGERSVIIHKEGGDESRIRVKQVRNCMQR